MIMRHHPSEKLDPSSARQQSEHKSFGAFPPNHVQRLIIRVGRRLPNNWIGKRLAAWSRSFAKRVATGPVDVEVLGVRMRLHLNNNASERRLFVTPQLFDPNDLATLASKISSDFSFVDLGANVGTYALQVARLAGSTAKILAVEPHPIAAQRLRVNVALNGYNIEVAQAAVADYDGWLELAVDTNNIGSSTVRVGQSVRDSSERTMVRACTLHRLVQLHNFRRIDAMKVDIEGAEYRTVLPFLATAPRNLQPNLIFLSPHIPSEKGRILSELAALGWRLISGRKMDRCVLQRVD